MAKTNKRKIPRLGWDAVHLIKWLSNHGGEGAEWIKIAPYREERPQANLRKAIDELVAARIAETSPHIPESDDLIEARLLPGHNNVHYQRPGEY